MAYTLEPYVFDPGYANHAGYRLRWPGGTVAARVWLLRDVPCCAVNDDHTLSRNAAGHMVIERRDVWVCSRHRAPIVPCRHIRAALDRFRGEG